MTRSVIKRDYWGLLARLGRGCLHAAERPRDEPPGQLFDPIPNSIRRSWPAPSSCWAASTWSCAVGCWLRGNVPLEPNRSVDQLGRNLMDLVGHRHFGWCRDASFLSCFTELGRLEELARPCRVLVFSKEDEIVGFVGATEHPKIRK